MYCMYFHVGIVIKQVRGLLFQNSWIIQKRISVMVKNKSSTEIKNFNSNFYFFHFSPNFSGPAVFPLILTTPFVDRTWRWRRRPRCLRSTFITDPIRIRRISSPSMDRTSLTPEEETDIWKTPGKRGNRELTRLVFYRQKRYSDYLRDSNFSFSYPNFN